MDVACMVLLNQDQSLFIEFQNSYWGLTELATYHLTFDLRTGRQLAV